jgi:MFS family permease
MRFRLLPDGATHDARVLLGARGLRAFGDGFISLLLPFYLTLLGFSEVEVGLVVTATLLGAGATTFAAGFLAHRYGAPRLLGIGAILTCATGVALVFAQDFWPLVALALVGTLNPTTGDVTLFAPLEHALLTRSAPARSRTALFARYSVVGSLVIALGSQAAALPALVRAWGGIDIKLAVQAMFVLYACIGIAGFLAYRRLSPIRPARTGTRGVPLRESRKTVYKLAALFSLDAFGGGFVAQSLLALWLFQRFDLSIAATATIFFWTGIFTALSQLASPWVAARLGLVKTMVYTHVPANALLIAVPFMPALEPAIVLLCVRAFFSSMDVPARSSYVMAVVTAAERPAAASMTVVPRSVASAASPALAGYLLALSPFGWPLVAAGALKLTYDILLLTMFSRVKPPEERGKE